MRDPVTGEGSASEGHQHPRLSALASYGAARKSPLCFWADFPFFNKQTALTSVSGLSGRIRCLGSLDPHSSLRGWCRGETGHREAVRLPTAAQPGRGFELPGQLWGKTPALGSSWRRRPQFILLPWVLAGGRGQGAGAAYSGFWAPEDVSHRVQPTTARVSSQGGGC